MIPPAATRRAVVHRRRNRHVGIALASALAVACVLPARTARAAGLYYSERGVRPLGRGGAFVAGADDVGAIWFNPAGLADAKTSILVDFAWVNFASEFTRKSTVPDSNGTLREYTFPTVKGTTPILPIPTIGGSLVLDKKQQWTGAFGILVPYAALTTYPSAVNGDPAPSRYSLVSLEGSALVIAGAHVAYKPIEQLRFGLGLQALVGTFASSVYFSASPPDRLLGAPEDPKYDSLSQLNVGPIFAPSAVGGVTAVPDKHVRIGLAMQAPFFINAPGKIQVRLPNAAVFDDAHQVGDELNVKFTMPAIFRAGVEVRPTDSVRFEVAYVREFWSAHKDISVTAENVILRGVTGFPRDFKVSNINLPRNFQDSNSFRAGGELMVPFKGYLLSFRGGAMYETTAVPTAMLSPLTVDFDKLIVSLGGGLNVGKHWRFDAVFAHVFTSPKEVTPAEAASPRVNPVKGNPTATEAVNGGTYSATANVIGVGLNYKF